MLEFGHSPIRQRDFNSISDDLGLFLDRVVDVYDFDLRHHAVAEFLCRIPIEDYRRLKVIKDKQYFVWFIPASELLGMVESFEPNIIAPEPRADYCKAIYLSPLLENLSPDIALAVVAIRLAIVLLYNDPQWLGEDEEQIAAAREQAIQWGFTNQLMQLDGIAESH